MLTWSPPSLSLALALGCVVSLCACGYDDSAYAPEVASQTGEEPGDATAAPTTSSGPAGTSPPATSPLAITTSTLPTGTMGVRYAARVLVLGGAAPYAFHVSAGALPDGLALDGASGDVAGTPTAAGMFTATVAVEDSSVPPQLAERAFTIEIR